MNEFIEQLTYYVNNFKNVDRTEIESFCDSIHDAEADGYEVSEEEDMLWEKLTSLLQESR